MTEPLPPSAAAPAAPSPAPVERDRIVVNLAWEGLLALAAISTTLALFLGNDGLTFASYAQMVAPIGLAATAVAFSLRTGAPNLAVGAIASMAGSIGAQLATAEDFPVPVAMFVAVLIGIVASLIIGVVTAALSVPSWITTLGFAVIITMSLQDAFGGRGILLRDAGGAAGGFLWFFAFALISLGGGAIWWLVPGVRPALSGPRDPALPGRWSGFRPALGTVVGLTVSGFLASLAGVAYAVLRNFITPEINGSITYAGFAAALLGGATIFGRRAGLAGTFLAVLLIQSITTIIVIEDAESVVDGILPGVAIVIGLAIGRGIEVVNNSLNPRQRLLILTDDPRP